MRTVIIVLVTLGLVVSLTGCSSDGAAAFADGFSRGQAQGNAQFNQSVDNYYQRSRSVGGQTQYCNVQYVGYGQYQTVCH